MDSGPGSIRLYIGPMFARKTSSMIDDVERYHIMNRLCVIIKYTADIRYDHLASSGGVVTHAGHERSKVPVERTQTLADIYDVINEYDVIGVDEVQFYPDAPEVLQRLANAGKIIICAGLDATWKGEIFGRMGELIALAEEVTKLKAVCGACCSNASFTKKLSGTGDDVEIGGADKYIPMCRRCMW